MVYVINAHDCYESFLPAELTVARNQLFTAITRSKAWVRVLGIGKRMEMLIKEYERIRVTIILSTLSTLMLSGERS